MHQGNRDWLLGLKSLYPDAFMGAVLELGSGNVNGTARDYFKDARRYVGVDQVHGKDVDLCLPCARTAFREGEFDTLLCLSLFEHDPLWHESFGHNLPFVREGGMIFVCFGAEGNLRHPPEPWRIVPVKDWEIAAAGWPIEVLDAFFEETRYTKDCPGAYDVVARKS
jgi:hypothetical protein